MDMIKVYDKEGNELGLEPRECGTTQPETLGYQRCDRPAGHKGQHKSQDGKKY